MEIVEQVSGVKLMETANNYIVFQPLTQFRQVWNDCVVPAYRFGKEKSEQMQAEICAAWKRL